MCVVYCLLERGIKNHILFVIIFLVSTEASTNVTHKRAELLRALTNLVQAARTRERNIGVLAEVL
jgi:hypothetical protein